MLKSFEKTQLKGLSLENRYVYSATWDGLADDKGFCTARNREFLVERARGGVGLVVTGMAFVSPEGRGISSQLAIYGDEFIPGLAEMAAAIHGAGSKVVVQLAHGGCYAPPTLTGSDVLGPSTNKSEDFPECREITLAEIKQVAASFAKAAGRAKKAGYDGVQLHAAHGYLMSQFLSPFFNKRTDNYGGSIENRARIILEAVRAVRNEVGEEYPLLVKINSEDFVKDGLVVDEMLQVCAMLEKAGVDAIEMSGGTVYASGAHSCFRAGVPEPREKESYYRKAAARYKESIGIPLMLVGGIRSLDVSEELIKNGLADYISLSRPLIREPDLIKLWQSGDARPATCMYCNGCLGSAVKGDGLKCIQDLK